MGDKYKWIRTWWPVGLVAFAVITSYVTLKSDVDSLKTDTTATELIKLVAEETKHLDDVKLEKETFIEYKDRQEKEFDEFKTNQKETNDKLHSIDLKMVTIEGRLKQILTAVNNK